MKETQRAKELKDKINALLERMDSAEESKERELAELFDERDTKSKLLKTSAKSNDRQKYKELSLDIEFVNERIKALSSDETDDFEIAKEIEKLIGEASVESINMLGMVELEIAKVLKQIRDIDAEYHKAIAGLNTAIFVAGDKLGTSSRGVSAEYSNMLERHLASDINFKRIIENVNR